MLSAQLRQEVTRPAGVSIDAARVRALCRQHPVGAIVDNKMRLKVWAAVLLDAQPPPPLPNVEGLVMDPEDARVVEADVKRTRGYLPIFQEAGTQELMRTLLTTHCLASGMKYKQGLHELLAPFVSLSPDPPSPPLAPEMVYALFRAFTSRYMGPFFQDDGMAAVRQGFGLLKLLLSYHDPELAGHLSREGFLPEMYATPFFLTLFAHNLELFLVHRLWDTYISVDDTTLVYFLTFGLLTLRRDLLLHADAGGLPEMVPQVRLRCPEDIAAVLHTALKARAQTPLSFTRDLHRATLPDRRTPSIPIPIPIPAEEGKAGEDAWEESQGLPPLNFQLMAAAASGVMEIAAAELVRSLLAIEEAKQQQQQQRRADADASASASPSNMSSTSASPSSPRAAAGPAGSEAIEDSSSAHAALPPPIRYRVIDARSHEEFSASGGGVLRGSLRLGPQAALQAPSSSVAATTDGLESWLRLHGLFPSINGQRGRESPFPLQSSSSSPPRCRREEEEEEGFTHVCVIGSRIRRRRHGGHNGGGGGSEPAADSLWRRLLLGEGGEEEALAEAAEKGEGGEEGEGPAVVDTGDMVVKALRARRLPRVAKLRGGFDALLDFLVLCHGPGSIGISCSAAPSKGFVGNGGRRVFVLPLVERHDPVAWERWRRKVFRLSKLPPAFYTTTGLQRPMVLPSEKEGPASRHHRFKGPNSNSNNIEGGGAFPPRRLRPEAMLEMAMALETATAHGHATAAATLRSAIHVQKRMIELGIGVDDEEEEEEERAMARDGGGKRLPSLSLLPASVASALLPPPPNSQLLTASQSKQPPVMMLGKAQRLLDKADSWVMSGVMVMRGSSSSKGTGSSSPKRERAGKEEAGEGLDG